MTKTNEIYYVWCHFCKKVIAKGIYDEIATKRCDSSHTYTTGRKQYFDRYYPDIELENQDD